MSLTADAVMVGANAADAVYLGAEWVWPGASNTLADFAPYLWVDASQETAVGDRVAPTDRAGNVTFGSAAGVSGIDVLPELRANALNGLPGLDFDTTAQAATSATVDLTAGATVLMLAEFQTGPTYNGPLSMKYGSLGVDIYWVYDYYLTMRTGNGNDYIQVAVGGISGMGALTGRPVIHNLEFSTGKLSMIVNGRLVTDTITAGTPGPPSPSGRVVIGGGYPPGGPMKGTIYEMAICPTLSTEDAQKGEGILAWKWGVQGHLPVSHPFKEAPPS